MWRVSRKAALVLCTMAVCHCGGDSGGADFNTDDALGSPTADLVAPPASDAATDGANGADKASADLFLAGDLTFAQAADGAALVDLALAQATDSATPLVDLAVAGDLSEAGTTRPDLATPPGCVMLVGNKLDVDVPAITLKGRLTINGKTATGGGGAFWLRNPITGDEAMLGDPAGTSYTARVVPATYDVFYRYDPLFVTAGAARNRNATVKTAVTVSASGTLDLDLVATVLSGKVTVAGATAPSGGGRLYLKSTARDDDAPLFAFSGAQPYAALVAPGSYDVYYRSMGAGPVANTNMKVASAIGVAGASQTLDVDVPAVSLLGYLKANGQTNNIYGNCDVILRRADGDSAKLGTAATGWKYSVLVAPGSYDVYCGNSMTDPTGDATRNTDARVMGPITLSASSMSYDLDVPVAAIIGKGTLNGNVAPPGGRIYLRKAQAVTQLGPDDFAFIGFPNEPSFYPAHVLPGLYDVFHVVLDTSFTSSTLRNRNYRVQAGFAIAGTGNKTLVVDLPGAMVTGTFTENGGVPPMVGGQLLFESTSQPGDTALLGYLGATTSGLVAPGSYDLYYGNVNYYPTDAALRNRRILVKSGIAVAGATAFSADIKATHLTGKVTVNGMVDTFNLDSHIVLRSLDGKDQAHLAPLSSYTHDSWIAPGTYWIEHVNTYPNRTDGTDVRNARARLGCVMVP